MKISYRWLKQYIDLDLSPEKLATILTDCGLEVEAVEEWESVKGGLEGVVVGEVISCTPHTGSDHLSLTTVHIGNGKMLPVVCGAPNVASGQKVAVATVGTTLWFGEKELEIKKARIRGEISEGMICAEDELGLGSSHEGILVLDPDAVPGTPASEYFQVATDVVFQIGLTPNRSDATSHIGVARDVVAVLNNAGGSIPALNEKKILHIPDLSSFSVDNQSLPVAVSVQHPTACQRYSGLTVSNLKIGESPDWLKNLLLAVGLRPINNVVDITNFVLMETGQPLHAFDADKITGNRIIVKTYPEGTSFVTLDEVKRTLTADDLMICSETEPLCIGGVFGGVHSGVTENTQRIFLESACFNPVSIRKTARHHGLQTDASFRFERGSDIQMTLYALKRAALLLREMAGGEISSPIVDIYPNPKPPLHLSLPFQRLDSLMGKQIPRVAIEHILKDLGFSVLEITAEAIRVEVPSNKTDVTREADLMEEILRIYGYNNIGFSTQVRSSLPFTQLPDRGKIRNACAEMLTAKGFMEIQTNSLTSSVYYSGNPVFPEPSCVRIVNPSSRELDVMRQTLLYGGLETIRYNQNRRATDLKLYENGTVYSLKEPAGNDPLNAFHEEEHLALFLTGRLFPESWNTTDHPEELFTLKSYVQDLFHRVNLPMEMIPMDQDAGPLFSAGFRYTTPDAILAVGGLVSPTILRLFDIKTPVLYADLALHSLISLIPGNPVKFTDLPKFPVVRRDLALLIDETITYEQIRQTAIETEKRLLLNVDLFDVYAGENLEKGKCSYAISFYLGDSTKTLTDKEIDKVMQKLITAFTQKLGASLR